MDNNHKTDLSVFLRRAIQESVLAVLLAVSNSAEMVERAYEHGWAGVCYKTLNSDRIPIIHPSPRMSPYHDEKSSSWACRTWSRSPTARSRTTSRTSSI